MGAVTTESPAFGFSGKCRLGAPGVARRGGRARACMIAAMRAAFVKALKDA